MPSAAPDDDDRVFKALANPNRRALLDHLREASRSTKELAAALPHLDRTTVLLHLRVLADAGLVVSQRHGRERRYTLDVAPIQAVYHRWIHDYARPAAALLLRLKEELEHHPPDNPDEPASPAPSALTRPPSPPGCG